VWFFTGVVFKVELFNLEKEGIESSDTNWWKHTAGGVALALLTMRAAPFLLS
jgi:hypothetical protein